LLHRHGLSHPWLPGATAFCWERIDRLERADPYEVRSVLTFLEHAPDRTRAGAALTRIGRLMAGQHLVAPGRAGARGGEAPAPLSFAPEPGSPARRLFTGDVIDAHLDALVDAQAEDGGWPVSWPVWTPATGLEWRSWLTIDALARLRANGRW